MLFLQVSQNRKQAGKVILSYTQENLDLLCRDGMKETNLGKKRGVGRNPVDTVRFSLSPVFSIQGLLRNVKLLQRESKLCYFSSTKLKFSRDFDDSLPLNDLIFMLEKGIYPEDLKKTLSN